jgi:predicted metalloprotease
MPANVMMRQTALGRSRVLRSSTNAVNSSNSSSGTSRRAVVVMAATTLLLLVVVAFRLGLYPHLDPTDLKALYLDIMDSGNRVSGKGIDLNALEKEHHQNQHLRKEVTSLETKATSQSF